MPSGMQVFGPDSALWLDTNERVGKIMGNMTATASGSYPVGLAGLGEPFSIMPVPSIDSWSDQNGNNFSAPSMGVMSFQDGGNTLFIQFTFSGATNPNAYVFYGTF